jgi:hypothetical protein
LDDVCDIAIGNSFFGGNIHPNYIAVGRKKAVVGADTVLNINVFALQSEQSMDTPSCLNPNDFDNEMQTCAKKDFVELLKTASNPFEYVKVEYLFGSNRKEHVFQAFDNWSPSVTKTHLPKIFPFVIRYMNDGDTVERVQIINETDSIGPLDSAPTINAAASNPFYIRKY